MTPHMEAIAFRIWQVAEPKGWDLTLPEAAKMAGTSTSYASKAVRAKGWLSRFRAHQTDGQAYKWKRISELGVGGGVYVGFDQ